MSGTLKHLNVNLETEEVEESDCLPELRVPGWYRPGALEGVHLCHDDGVAGGVW